MNGPLPTPIHDIAAAFERMAAAVTSFSASFERASEIAGGAVRDTVLHAALRVLGNRYFTKG